MADRKSLQMNIDEILREYDAMFGRNTLAEVEEYLTRKMSEAREVSRADVLFALLNEAVGFFRDTTQREKSLKCCDELLALMDVMGLKGSYEYATALLNIANAYRAFGLFAESLAFFENTFQIYRDKVSAGDFAYANLYNNWSLLYQEMGDFKAAVGMLEQALAIVNAYENAVIQQATTHTNLAATLLQIGTEDAYRAAEEHLRTALKIFEADGGRDFHYGAALVAMGDACAVKRDYAAAAGYYKAGLRELEKHVGRTDNYDRVLEKYRYAKGVSGTESNAETAEVSEQKRDDADVVMVSDKREWKSNLERSREFYEQYGVPMIHNLFSEYEERISVGLVGEGSDCYGFDDGISADHDYEVGFCMWLTDGDYKEIGIRLQEAYKELFAGLVWDEQTGKMIRREVKTDEEELSETVIRNRFLNGRRGVFTINGFYNQLLGTSENYEQKVIDCPENAGVANGGAVQEFQLAAATNGQVFRDDAGVFGGVRKQLLAYYPEDVWRKKMAQSLHEYAQYAQSNYARMMARGDMITANLCVGKGVEAAMDLLYLLNRRYAPYYKWKRKGLEKLIAERGGQDKETVKQVLQLVEAIAVCPQQSIAWKNVRYDAATLNMQDECVRLFEKVADLLLGEMKRQGIVKGQDVFLERYVEQVLYGKTEDDEDMEANLVEQIVALEWEQFDKVKNEGGRADCQDNFPTFSIMRKSQYLAWTEELLLSYRNDLVAAQNGGWNLIMEKYARMMQSTAQEKYAELEKNLPMRSQERIAIQEEIIKIQVTWMEDFAARYPKMADNARSIRTEEDNEYNTSYETYLRGEMGTYSEDTFVLYGRFIVGLVQAGRNLAYEIMENTAHLYGYESVEDAESKL